MKCSARNDPENGNSLDRAAESDSRVGFRRRKGHPSVVFVFQQPGRSVATVQEMVVVAIPFLLVVVQVRHLWRELSRRRWLTSRRRTVLRRWSSLSTILYRMSWTVCRGRAASADNPKVMRIETLARARSSSQRCLKDPLALRSGLLSKSPSQQLRPTSLLVSGTSLFASFARRCMLAPVSESGFWRSTGRASKHCPGLEILIKGYAQWLSYKETRLITNAAQSQQPPTGDRSESSHRPSPPRSFPAALPRPRRSSERRRTAPRTISRMRRRWRPGEKLERRPSWRREG